MKKFISGLLVTSLLATVLGVFIPGSTSTAEAAITNWHRSVSVLPNTTTDLASDAYKESMRDLKATGANMVTIIVPYYQTNQWSTDLGPGSNTPTDAALISAIQYAKSIGLQVVLKVHAENSDWAWRAYIEPGDRDTWYGKYGAILNHLADIGQAQGVSGIVIGAEMIKTATYTSNPDNTQRWVKMINDVRSRFSGFLTYSANWGGDGFYNEVSSIGFWQHLDYIGISAYYDMNSNGSVEGIMNRWNDWRVQRIEPLRNQYNKQILFTEVGYRSVDNARYSPWDSGMGGGYNPTEQANLYEAMFKYWNNYSYFAGVSLWRWSVNPNDGGTGNTYYWPQNKPAEEVMKKYWGGGGTPVPPTNPGTTTPPTNPQPSNWTSQASINNPQQNVQATGNASVTSTNAASGVLVDLEIYNSTGNRVFQQVYENQSFTANQAKQLQFQWTPAATGSYTLKLGTFSNNWSTNYHWNDAALNFNVSSGNTTPPPATTTPTTTPPTNPPAAAWSAQASVPNAQQNAQATGNVSVTSANAASGVLVDVEIYKQGGNRVFQQFFENQSFSANHAKQFQFNWTPAESGSYTLKLGTFSNNWSTNYYWNDALTTISVASGGTTPPPATTTPTTTPPTNPNPNPQPSTYTTNVWWPSNGSKVFGNIPFKAMVEGLSVSDYKMYWQVDGDQLHEMYNSDQDYPHKEAWVDVSGWNWKGSGPYALNFVSKNMSGTTISQSTVNITVGQ